MKDELLALIKYRLKEAEDSIEEAKVLLKEDMSHRAVMNRLYYTLFYAVLALLQEKQTGTSKHIGAISLFDREFIKRGVFDKELSKTLHRAFELRQKGDYMEQSDIIKEDVDEIFPKALDFVNKVNAPALKDGACKGSLLYAASIPTLKSGAFRAAVKIYSRIIEKAQRRTHETISSACFCESWQTLCCKGFRGNT